MESVSPENLRDTIQRLERKQTEEGKMMRERLFLVCDSLKPVNLVRSALEDIAESRELKDKLLTMSVGLTVGYVSRKIFEGRSQNRFRKLMGSALQLAITKAIVKKP